MKKFLSLCFFVILILFAFSKAHLQKAYSERASSAHTGWTQIDDQWYYYNQNGEKLTGWVEVDGKWYYMNPDGAMQTGWLQSDGKWYFLRQSGAMQTGWLESGGKWYYFRQSGAMQTGWLRSGSKWYYFRPSGAMHTGWLQSGGKWYYFRQSGAMRTGWLQDNGKWYYMNPDGAMQTGWVQNNDQWYYLRQSGAMYTGWLQVDGRWYCFRSTGSMVPGEEMVKVEAKAPTALAPGNIEYYQYGSPLRYFADPARTQEIAPEDTVLPQLADIDITTLLKTAMQPVGETLYVLGGGWNASDDGAGETATYLGVYPNWKTFYDANKEGYSYEPGMRAWYQGDRSWRFLGLDCSGFIGWALYNSFDASVRLTSGYVWGSTSYADHMAWLGYGTTAEIDASQLKAGDIVSMTEKHVYLVLGRCSDGSILMLQSVPNGGVVVSGSGFGTKATRLAGAFMRNHCPDWWYYFSQTGLYSSPVPRYLTGKYFTWTNRFSDSAGLRNLSGEEVLAYLESQL